MSEEEKDILVTKRKYWAQFMKYNLAYTIFFGIALTLIFMTEVSGTSYERLILFYIPSSWLWIFASWPLSIIMYVYHSLKIHEITKPKVLAKSSGNFEALVKKDRMKNPTLALISDHLWWLAFVAKLGLISMLISFSLLIMAGL